MVLTVVLLLINGYNCVPEGTTVVVVLLLDPGFGYNPFVRNYKSINVNKIEQWFKEMGL